MDSFFATCFLIIAGLAVLVVIMLVVACGLNVLAGIFACIVYPLQFILNFFGLRRPSRNH